MERTLNGRPRFEFDAVLRHLMYLGLAALFTWLVVGLVGTISGAFTIAPHGALKFLVAVLVLVFARRTYWELREWHWRRIPADQRYGFSSPLWENPRGSERLALEGAPEILDPNDRAGSEPTAA